MLRLLMGNEAFAHAALEAGVGVIAGYPGTPSSELIETVAKLRRQGSAKGIHVEWSTNEAAALEVCAGASISGVRSLMTCKQVGMNVASDALLSLNYVGIRGGLVLFVADDPGPISSQTEQDTRSFAAFAKVPVLDPATPEQGFQMMKAAFQLSEEYKTPVIVRPTTRICHASTFFDVEESTHSQLPEKLPPRDPNRFVIFPRRSYQAHGEVLERLDDIAHDFSYYEEFSRFNPVYENDRQVDGASIVQGDSLGFVANAIDADAGDDVDADAIGIACSGVSTQYVLEALSMIRRMAKFANLPMPRYRLVQFGTSYPFPRRVATRFFKGLSDVLVIEELDAFVEEELLKIAGAGFLAPTIHGKLTGEADVRGENTTEGVAVRIAAFFDAYASIGAEDVYQRMMERMLYPDHRMEFPGELPKRAPVLCAGCPHRASFIAVKRALKQLGVKRADAVFCGDIGCYTLGNAAPLDAVDTCLCMGAGITMAQGFSIAQGLVESEGNAEARTSRAARNAQDDEESAQEPVRKSIAFAGDSTFFASGMTGIANAAYNDHDVTVVVLDNSTTAMTGMQPHPGSGPTLMGASGSNLSIPETLQTLGFQTVIRSNPLDMDQAREDCAEALSVEGPSAVIFESPCIWTVPFNEPLSVDWTKCTGCRKCITEVGCPAIWFDASARGPRSSNRGQARVDASQCNGCTACAQICPADAFITQGQVDAENALFDKVTAGAAEMHHLEMPANGFGDSTEVVSEVSIAEDASGGHFVQSSEIEAHEIAPIPSDAAAGMASEAVEGNAPSHRSPAIEPDVRDFVQSEAQEESQEESQKELPEELRDTKASDDSDDGPVLKEIWDWEDQLPTFEDEGISLSELNSLDLELSQETEAPEDLEASDPSERPPMEDEQPLPEEELESATANDPTAIGSADAAAAEEGAAFEPLMISFGPSSASLVPPDMPQQQTGLGYAGIANEPGFADYEDDADYPGYDGYPDDSDYLDDYLDDEEALR